MRVIASGQLSVAHSPRRRPQGQAPSLVDTAVQSDGTFRADAPLSLRRLVEVGALRTRLARRLADPALSRDSLLHRSLWPAHPLRRGEALSHRRRRRGYRGPADIDSEERPEQAPPDHAGARHVGRALTQPAVVVIARNPTVEVLAAAVATDRLGTGLIGAICLEGWVRRHVGAPVRIAQRSDHRAPTGGDWRVASARSALGTRHGSPRLRGRTGRSTRGACGRDTLFLSGPLWDTGRA